MRDVKHVCHEYILAIKRLRTMEARVTRISVRENCID